MAKRDRLQRSSVWVTFFGAIFRYYGIIAPFTKASTERNERASSRFSMSDSDENIPYGRKFGSGFRGTRYDGTVADDVENTPIIPDDMFRRIVLAHLDIHLDRVKIERFHFFLPFMHIASACENQSSERSERIIGVPARRTDGVSLNRPEILPVIRLVS